MKCNVAEFIYSLGDGGDETLVKDYTLLLDKNKIRPSIIVFVKMSDTANSKILSQHGIKVINIYNNTNFK